MLVVETTVEGDPKPCVAPDATPQEGFGVIQKTHAALYDPPGWWGIVFKKSEHPRECGQQQGGGERGVFDAGQDEGTNNNKKELSSWLEPKVTSLVPRPGNDTCMPFF